jgi:MFS superfamily sulfate permease-like transporter
MSKENSSSSSSGIGFCGLLTVAFVVLKLVYVIDWSWWWVLSPIWIPTGIVVFVLLVIFLVAVFATHHKDTHVNDDKADTHEPRAGKTLGL